MMKQTTLWLFLLITAVLGVACTVDQSDVELALPGPYSWIDSPLDGSSLPLGTVDVVSHSTNPSHIVAVELSVNGAVVRTDSSTGTSSTLATVHQPWLPPAPGTYTLQVRAKNSADAWGDYAGKMVTILAAGQPAQVAATVVAKAAATATPTSVPTPTLAKPGAPATLPAMTITFYADTTTLVQGQCTTLRWRIANASQASLDNAVTGLTGSKQDCPGQTTTHVLRVTTLDKQSVQRTVTITVVPPTKTSAPPPAQGCSGTPVISSFTASPASITAGGSSTLNWGAVTNADSVSIDPGIGGVGTPGSVTVSPGGTTTYTLTAHCGNNLATKSATVTVTGVHPATQPTPTNAPSPSATNPPAQPPSIGNPYASLTQFYFNAGTCGPKQVTIKTSATDAKGISGVQVYFRLADKASSATTAWTPASMQSADGVLWTRTFNSDTDIPNVNSYFNAWFQFYFVATNTRGLQTSSVQYGNMVTLANCSGIH